jgi:hypothetical protein
MEKKISKFKCNKVSVLIILVFLSLQSWRLCLRSSSVVVSSKGKKAKTKHNTKQKKPHKVSQVQMQYSFSKFFSMQM